MRRTSLGLITILALHLSACGGDEPSPSFGIEGGSNGNSSATAGGSQIVGGSQAQTNPSGQGGGATSNNGSVAPVPTSSGGANSASSSVAQPNNSGGTGTVSPSSGGSSATTGGTKATSGAVTGGGRGPAAGGRTGAGGNGPATGTTTPGLGGNSPTPGGRPGAGGNSPTPGGRPGANGGSPAAGGQPALGGSSAAAGNTGSTSCSVAPVDPDAIPQAKNLLCYLYSIYKQSVLSGQQETSWNAKPSDDVEYYNKLVKKYPAVQGFDYLYTTATDNTTTTSRAQAWWQAGGIVLMRYHMGAPPNADTYENSKLSFSSTQCSNVIKTGTTEGDSFLKKLDGMAANLKTLETAKVPVLLALFHEVQANGWFWWSKCSAAQFIALYKYSYDYVVKTKGVHNVIWIMPYSSNPDAAYYPGKEYVDLGGPDNYLEPAQQPFASLYTKSAGIFGSTMPIPLHETGTIPQPSAMFPSAAPWVLWNVWAGYYTGSWDSGNGKQTTFNTDADITKAYSDSHTITRDELPNLK